MPKSVPHLRGMIVTAIVVFGADFELYYAVPLGIFAGVLAAFFISLADAHATPAEPSAATEIRPNFLLLTSSATSFAAPYRTRL